MIIFFRSFLFDCFYYLWTVILAVLGLPLLLFPRKGVVCLSRLWNHGNLWLMRHVLGLTYKVNGTLPKAPFILASKHESSFETLLFSVLLKDPAFILKHSLLHIPLVGWYLRKVAMISVKKKKGRLSSTQMLEAAEKALKMGRPLVIFPEGTRTPPGAFVALKPGVWHFYKSLKVPVVTAALNSGAFWPRHALVKKPGVVSLTFKAVDVLPEDDKNSFLAKVKRGLHAH